MTRPARARRETVPRSRRLLAAHTLAWDGLMRLSERRVQEKRCACHHAPSRSGPTTSCRSALSGSVATSTMTGGSHGRAHVPPLQKAARVAHTPQQQLATSVQTLLSQSMGCGPESPTGSTSCDQGRGRRLRDRPLVLVAWVRGDSRGVLEGPLSATRQDGRHPHTSSASWAEGTQCAFSDPRGSQRSGEGMYCTQV